MHQLLSIRFKIGLIVVIAMMSSAVASGLGYGPLSLSSTVGGVEFVVLWLMLHSWKLCAWVPLVPRPKWAKTNLSGKWSGHISSSWKKPSNGASPAPIFVTLVVHQNWREVVFSMTTDGMNSRSSDATISFDAVTNELRFRYFYQTEPSVSSSKENPPQIYGSAVAIVDLHEPSTMRIQYTNERGRGDITLKREAK